MLVADDSKQLINSISEVPEDNLVSSFIVGCYSVSSHLFLLLYNFVLQVLIFFLFLDCYSDFHFRPVLLYSGDFSERRAAIGVHQ